ncbi:MAG: T9SS type A sorting domain-containing protein [Bacteroidetes bacterium]|nr:T9SS type A sorting domain-containing protein [Bacteroidota bacterium]
MPKVIPQDFQVSTSGAATLSVQVASDSSGRFVVVWDDGRNIRIPYGGTGSEGDIYGQRYDNKGAPVGNNFRISDDSSECDKSFAAQFLPRISMNKKGEFVVVWMDSRPKATPDNSTAPLEFNVYAQRFDSRGEPLGSNFLVDSPAIGGQLNPDVVMRNDGSFVVIWVNSLESEGGVNKVFRVYLQSFDSKGRKVGLIQKLNLYAQEPRIALFDDGDFVIVADTLAQVFSFPSDEVGVPFRISKGFTRVVKTSDENCTDIYGQRFNLDLSRIRGDLKISHESDKSEQLVPACAMENNTIQIAWLDARGMRYFTNVYPPQLEIDVWATIQDFNNPTEGLPTHCSQPPSHIPSSFKFFQSYPNPTNGMAAFAYDLPEDGTVRLTLYNILGEEVTLLGDEFQKAGHYTRDFMIDNLSSGIYLARLSVKTISGSTHTSTIKLVLLK